jgi:hypothetical protein
MTAREKIRHGYMVSLNPWGNHPTSYRLCYVRRGLQQERGMGGSPKSVPQYFALVHANAEVPVKWDNKPPPDPDAKPEDFDQDAQHRVRLLDEWLFRLRRLIHTVRGWAEDLGWSTREIEKPMEDSEIGNYQHYPALLLQEGTTKALLEPVGRSSPGSEGLVDLYLMPAYDDIASLYYHNNRWNLHYAPRVKPGTESSQTEGKLLTKASFRKALDEMKKHAQESVWVAHED